MAAAETLSLLPQLAVWLKSQVDDPGVRAFWLALLLKISVIIALGLAAGRLTGAILASPRRSLESRETEFVLTRALFLMARTVLDLAPVAAFAVAAYVAVSVMQLHPRAHLVALSVINAYLISSGLLVLARMVLVPAAPSLRLFALGGGTANYLYIWVRRPGLRRGVRILPHRGGAASRLARGRPRRASPHPGTAAHGHGNGF